MKSVLLTAPGRFAVRDVPEPSISQPSDVLLRMQAVGVCGSDLHYYRTGRIGDQVLRDPWVIGHECTAVVERVGEGVAGLAPGDRVAVDPLIACGSCDQCLAGRANTCRKQRFLGCPGQCPGCMSELLVMPGACCLPVPERLSVGAAVMVEPFAIALHALHLAGDSAGLAIGVLGSGPIGLCVLGALQLSRPRSVHVTDKLGYRLAQARALEATATHELAERDAVAEILRQEPHGLDVVFDCSGEQAALDQSLHLLKPGGTLVIVGIPELDRVSFDINLMRRKELRIENVRRQNECTNDAIEILSSGRVNLDAVVTHHFDAADSQTAFDLVANYRDGVSKALVHFS
jgi:L-iditol 2-dehydrogenase